MNSTRASSNQDPSSRTCFSISRFDRNVSSKVWLYSHGWQENEGWDIAMQNSSRWVARKKHGIGKKLCMHTAHEDRECFRRSWLRWCWRVLQTCNNWFNYSTMSQPNTIHITSNMSRLGHSPATAWHNKGTKSVCETQKRAVLPSRSAHTLLSTKSSQRTEVKSDMLLHLQQCIERPPGFVGDGPQGWKIAF